jgi:hypothetical protein
MASPERKRDEVDPNEIATTLEEALKRGNEGDVDLTHITLAGKDKQKARSLRLLQVCPSAMRVLLHCRGCCPVATASSPSF